jgi:LmbE family N-acetylglucosaminyl deacetylase
VALLYRQSGTLRRALVYRSSMTPSRSTVVGAALLAVVASMPLVAQRAPRTLVALLAHADDETAASPVLARYAREGARVHMIVATDGSGGSGAQATLQRSENGPVGDALVKARADEARCSAAALGAQAPVLLTFPDGKLGDYLSDRTLLARLTDQIGAEIARLRPDVVITWGPDGGTGHPDHRLVSAIATQLLRTGAPGMPERLFYMYFPADAFTMLAPQRPPSPLFHPRAQYFTMKVPFTPADLAAAQAAMACHGTQFNPEQLKVMQPGLARLWNGVIAFIPAVSSFAGGDLFR